MYQRRFAGVVEKYTELARQHEVHALVRLSLGQQPIASIESARGTVLENRSHRMKIYAAQDFLRCQLFRG